MSYRHTVENWLGEVEYITVETPDEDYDRMKQEELDDEVMRRDEAAMLLRLCDHPASLSHSQVRIAQNVLRCIG